MNTPNLTELQRYQIKHADEQLMAAYCALSGAQHTLHLMADVAGKEDAMAQLKRASVELSGYSIAMFTGLDEKWGALFDATPPEPMVLWEVTTTDLSPGAGARGEDPSGSVLFRDEDQARAFLLEQISGYTDHADPDDLDAQEEDNMLVRYKGYFEAVDECSFSLDRRMMK